MQQQSQQQQKREGLKFHTDWYDFSACIILTEQNTSTKWRVNVKNTCYTTISLTKEIRFEAWFCVLCFKC